MKRTMYTMNRNAFTSDAAYCAPAASCASTAAMGNMAFVLGTVILAVSIFVVSALVLVLVGVRVLMITSLLVLLVLAGMKLNNTKFAEYVETAPMQSVCVS